MSPTLRVLCLGIVGALSAHFGWLTLSGDAHKQADLPSQLAWMQSSLHLSDAQLARIKALHEQSTPSLLALAGKVGGMRDELAQFERERTSTGRIDFLEFARFVESRRSLDRECARSTERLVAAVVEVMTPQQREQYLALLGPALKTLPPTPAG